jgi:hypothetical protein
MKNYKMLLLERELHENYFVYFEKSSSGCPKDKLLHTEKI